MKIAIIIPYFGQFPVWFDLYLYSCSKNPQVDFLFFTDCVLPKRIYDNTIFYKTDFKSYCKRVSDCLAIDFRPTNAYKLCDLKPFYGVIHKEELKDYDFWGFGDCDLVYGDLQILISKENLERYEFITTHSGRVAGHFTVMRKDSKYTLACLSIPEYKNKLQEKNHLGIDESDFSNIIFPELKNRWRFYIRIVKPLKIISENRYFDYIERIFFKRKSRLLFKECYTTIIPTEKDLWLYDLETGTLRRDSNTSHKLPYLHYLFFKKNCYEQTKFSWGDKFYDVPQDIFVKNTSSKVIGISAKGINVLNRNQL